MTSREERREAAIERMADHLLAEGLSGASLRPLAAAAGTSDRMLLYYFRDKDELLAATLERVAARLVAGLEAALPAGQPLSRDALLRAAWAVVGSEALKPFARLLLELAAASAGGRQPHAGIAARLVEGFHAWTAARLDVPEGSRSGEAARLLVTIEGMLFLTGAGRRDLAEQALPAGETG